MLWQTPNSGFAFSKPKTQVCDRMYSPGINGEGELRGQPANPGSPGKMAVKMECVCVCVCVKPRCEQSAQVMVTTPNYADHAVMVNSTMISKLRIKCSFWQQISGQLPAKQSTLCCLFLAVAAIAMDILTVTNYSMFEVTLRSINDENKCWIRAIMGLYNVDELDDTVKWSTGQHGISIARWQVPRTLLL